MRIGTRLRALVPRGLENAGALFARAFLRSDDLHHLEVLELGVVRLARRGIGRRTQRARKAEIA